MLESTTTPRTIADVIGKPGATALIQLAIAAALLGLIVYTFLPAEKRRAWGRKALLWGGVAFLVLLLVTGRLHWIFAIVAALWPLAMRLWPLIRAWPLLRRWLGGGQASADSGDTASAGSRRRDTRRAGPLSREEACEILRKWLCDSFGEDPADYPLPPDIDLVNFETSAPLPPFVP